MTTVPLSDEQWGRLAEMTEPARQTALKENVLEMSKLSETDRQARIRRQSEIEYALPDEKLRAIIVSRIRVWMDMDLSVVKPVAASLDQAMNHMTSNIAMKRVALVQTVARDFPLDQQERLQALVPGAFPHSAERAVSIGARLREDTARVAAGGAGVEDKKKPFWKFW